MRSRRDAILPPEPPRPAGSRLEPGAGNPHPQTLNAHADAAPKRSEDP